MHAQNLAMVSAANLANATMDQGDSTINTKVKRGEGSSMVTDQT